MSELTCGLCGTAHQGPTGHVRTVLEAAAIFVVTLVVSVAFLGLLLLLFALALTSNFDL